MRLALHVTIAALLIVCASARGAAPETHDEAVNAPAPQGKYVIPPPLSPEESLRTIRVRDGFTVELVAAEPLVADPVAFDWGPDGRLWVAEMRDYPDVTDRDVQPGGTIRCLEDTDGDGRYDRATVFLENVAFPSGVKAWRDGVLVAAAPDIFYAADSDGDGRADVREVLYHGFGEGNPQHRVNGFASGLDNWLYCANGNSGGQIESLKTGDKVPLNFSDVRIRPADGALELVLGQSQFSRVRDDAGNWFGTRNDDPLYQFVLDDRYVRRSRFVAPPPLSVDVSENPGTAPVYPISRTLARFNDFSHVNRFTSACGATLYRDELFGPEFVGNSFVSEPVHNLVHREILAPRGVLFTSHRAADEEHSEFLASSDNWFRPATLRVGPDGALWIADMYRAVIEHPDYIPDSMKEGLDLQAGNKLGRIYRVYPRGAKPRDIPRLDRLDSAGLVAALDAPSGWQRDAAQQLLVARRDPAAVPALQKMVASGTRPAARLQALCTLDGLAALDEATLVAALHDADGLVRRHGVRLSESWLARSPAAADGALALIADDDPHVRLQLACSLGAWDDPRAAAALGRMALTDADDPYISFAVISSVGRANLDGVTEFVLASATAAPPPAKLVDELLAIASALDDRRPLVRLLTALATPRDGRFASWQVAAAAGLLDALDGRNATLAKLRAASDDATQAAIDKLQPLFDFARATAVDRHAAEAKRIEAIRLLGRGLERQAADLNTLATLLTPLSTAAVLDAAIAEIGAIDDPHVPELLLSPWRTLLPEQRAAVLDVLLRSSDRAEALLNHVEQGLLAPGDIDAAHRQRLVESRDAATRTRAAQLFAAGTTPDRAAVIDRYRAVLTDAGDPERGRAIFRQHCAACHHFEGVGTATGPDLAALSDLSGETLLVAVFDPNRAVEPKFLNYAATTRAGHTFTGILTAETGTSITLRGADGKDHTIMRSDLESLDCTGRSLMPEGLEKDVSLRDFADLVAYLTAMRPPRRVFDGNLPRLIEPDDLHGDLWLLADSASLYGDTISFAASQRLLDDWRSPSDRVEWECDVKRGGEYDVQLDYACADATAGNPFRISLGEAIVAAEVQGTGGADTFRQLTVGRVTLKPGRVRVSLRADGAIAGSLMKLKCVRLTPVESH